jgi:hypothetical protein
VKKRDEGRGIRVSSVEGRETREDSRTDGTLEHWNDGIMENARKSGTEAPLTTPSFQYSTIPVFAFQVSGFRFQIKRNAGASAPLERSDSD